MNDNDNDIIDAAPLQVPTATLIWTAIVNVGPREDLGATSQGHRFIVPIQGGRFYAEQNGNGLNGIVLCTL